MEFVSLITIPEDINATPLALIKSLLGKLIQFKTVMGDAFDHVISIINAFSLFPRAGLCPIKNEWDKVVQGLASTPFECLYHDIH